jgi:hypothetical protein
MMYEGVTICHRKEIMDLDLDPKIEEIAVLGTSRTLNMFFYSLCSLLRLISKVVPVLLHRRRVFPIRGRASWSPPYPPLYR